MTKSASKKSSAPSSARIYLNECSQIPLASVDTVRTRLAQKTKLVNRILYDLNPSGTGHWCHRLFVERLNPHTRAPLPNPDDYASLVMNPIHNLDNLPPDYFPNLDTLPEKQRLRFKEGRWLSELDNALWSYDLLPPRASQSFRLPAHRRRRRSLGLQRTGRREIRRGRNNCSGEAQVETLRRARRPLHARQRPISGLAQRSTPTMSSGLIYA